MSAFGGKADLIASTPECPLIARSGHTRWCPTSPGMTAFNTTRTLRRMFNGTAYLDRAAPRFAPAKFLALVFTRRRFIEPGPGSNCPGWIFWPGRSALAARLLALCAAFAFARWRALALVISSSPFLSLNQSLQTKQHTRARNRTVRSARLVASPHLNHVEQAVRPQPELEAVLYSAGRCPSMTATRRRYNQTVSEPPDPTESCSISQRHSRASNVRCGSKLPVRTGLYLRPELGVEQKKNGEKRTFGSEYS